MMNVSASYRPSRSAFTILLLRRTFHKSVFICQFSVSLDSVNIRTLQSTTFNMKTTPSDLSSNLDLVLFLQICMLQMKWEVSKLWANIWPHFQTELLKLEIAACIICSLKTVQILHLQDQSLRRPSANQFEPKLGEKLQSFSVTVWEPWNREEG